VVDLLKQFIEAQNKSSRTAIGSGTAAGRRQGSGITCASRSCPPAIVTPCRDWQNSIFCCEFDVWANRTQANACQRHPDGASGEGSSNSLLPLDWI
jgi:hypothetical protein